jgi:site-specific recombinase XerD
MPTNFKAQLVLSEPLSDSKYNIKIRVSHNGKTRYIRTQFYIDKIFFDNKAGKVKKSFPDAEKYNVYFQKLIFEFNSKILNVDPQISIKQLDFFNYTQSFITKCNNLGKHSTAEIYKYTLVSLQGYLKTDELLFKHITINFLNGYRDYLQLKGLKINAISVYLRNIRTMFRRAIDDDITEQSLYPFIKFKIKSEKTTKRNLQIEILKKIKMANLTGRQAYARDMFLLSFYLIGINTIDLYHATEIIDNKLVYTRAKTLRKYSIELLPEAKNIIKQYPGKDKILNCSQIYNTVYNFRKAINKYLSQICSEMGLNIKPTTYYARHSWATIASKLKVDRDTIRAALGHGMDTVTDIYIDFDMAEVTKANKKVCKAIE